MKHSIPEYVQNATILWCIEQYVRLDRDKEILRDKWFGGLSFYELERKYDMSQTAVKRVIYQIGDKVLLRAVQHEKAK